MNIASWLYQTVRNWPERPAIYSGTDLFASYGSLGLRVSALAQWLARDFGIGQGDRVAIYAKNCPEYIEILHAIWWLGAIVVPVNYKLHAREAGWIIENCEASLALTYSAKDLAGVEIRCKSIAISGSDYQAAVVADVAQSQPFASESAEVAWLFYTSGTTGRPKGVMLTHDNLRHTGLCYMADVDQVNANQVYVYSAPISHGAGLYAFGFLRMGAAHLVPKVGGFDPDEIVQYAQKLSNICLFAAPTMVKRLIKRSIELDYHGEGISTIIYGGGPMYAADIDEAVAQYGSRFVQIYGQGETPMTISVLNRDMVADQTHPNWRARRDSVGMAQACIEIKIVGADGQALATGQTGEILVRGPTLMKGYWNNPEATAAAVVDGWLITGDLGYLDGDGFLALTDRSKDVIISGGTNIYPREVEEVLLRHPAVFEVAVIGTPDPEWGENVVAYVVTEANATCSAEELGLLCQSELASFKKPKRYVFVPSLPKNSYGKILKTTLREWSVNND